MTMELTEDTFVQYAAQHYKNPSCRGVSDFNDDLSRFKYITRLLNRYTKTGLLSERLILNHIILLYNVFGETATELLFFRIDQKYWPQLKPFLVFLNRLPLHYQVQDVFDETEIPLDTHVVQTLREI